MFGTEESHGYLVGQYARDKDGAVACMLMSELAAKLKSAAAVDARLLGRSVQAHGYHRESLINLAMEGSEGMAAMQPLHGRLPARPMKSLAGIAVAKQLDYQDLNYLRCAGRRSYQPALISPLQGPVGNLIIMDLAEPGNYVAVRPSGTEPKIKLYCVYPAGTRGIGRSCRLLPPPLVNASPLWSPISARLRNNTPDQPLQAKAWSKRRKIGHREQSGSESWVRNPHMRRAIRRHAPNSLCCPTCWTIDR